MKNTIKYDRNQPFNDLRALPPPENIETPAILKKVISASRALAELNGAITNLPNPDLFIDTVNLQEAQASSAIENIVTTQDELFKATVTDKAIDNPATKEVLHYKDALWQAQHSLNMKPVITTNLFIEVVQIIRKNNSGIRNIPGTQLKNPNTGKVTYTPPEGENLIRKKLNALEKFIHADDGLDPLIKMALIHYQFEAIHPFFDGNGRTGRILMVVYLKYSNLLALPALYLSRFIIENKNEYYKRLRGVTEKGEWVNWILYMLDMVESSAKTERSRISQIANLMESMGAEIQDTLPKLYSKDLIETLFRLPYTKRKFLTEAKLGNLKTVGNYLKELENSGYLKSEIVGKEKLYLNFKLMELLKQ